MDAYEAIIGKRDRRDYDSKPIPGRRPASHPAGGPHGRQLQQQPAVSLHRHARPGAKQKMAPPGPARRRWSTRRLPSSSCSSRARRDFDVGRAAQNMMVAAWADGIHSCPIGLREDAVAERSARPAGRLTMRRLASRLVTRPRTPRRGEPAPAAHALWRSWCTTTAGRRGDSSSAASCMPVGRGTLQPSRRGLTTAPIEDEIEP